jgi:alkylation response protein AidB-like acyl-CoA dehydrogenase
VGAQLRTKLGVAVARIFDFGRSEKVRAMDFEFTEEQALLRESLRRLITREYSFERRQSILAAHSCCAMVWRLFAQQGLLALGLPENVGGCGGPMEIMLAMEELGRGLVLEPFASTIVLGAGLIRDHGTVAQRAKLLPIIAGGDCRLALAHQETDACYVLDRVSTVARRGKGTYVLNGSKAMIFDAPVADMLIVSARDESAGGLSLFLVRPDVPGVRMTQFRTLDGRSAADIALENVKVPTAARLGSAGYALTALEQAVDCGLAALCAEAVGVMEAVNETSLHSLNTRKQSGQRVADMFIIATQAQSMSYLAARRCRESDRSVRRRALADARAFIGRAARFVAQESAQLYGSVTDSAWLKIGECVKRLATISASLSRIEHRSEALTGLLRAQA